ncbi:autotransporter outer membrane beta-barrel domain-containing protein [Phascolarctobacterium faecium]|uniref:autotransporter outer membrane beta-barrel domain-containing protein n=1 Tax=Phascolarctobacterium faecium TaxID=33025 RepID=UPI002673AEA4|nr:autotransporter outer membrane beta-barrel domain-containing protein [Phascolarctobacterium faecium]
MSKKASLAKKIAHTLMAMSIVYSSGINIVINEAYAAERTENITSGGTKEFEEKTVNGGDYSSAQVTSSADAILTGKITEADVSSGEIKLEVQSGDGGDDNGDAPTTMQGSSSGTAVAKITVDESLSSITTGNITVSAYSGGHGSAYQGVSGVHGAAAAYGLEVKHDLTITAADIFVAAKAGQSNRYSSESRVDTDAAKGNDVVAVGLQADNSNVSFTGASLKVEAINKGIKTKNVDTTGKEKLSAGGDAEVYGIRVNGGEVTATLTGELLMDNAWAANGAGSTYTFAGGTGGKGSAEGGDGGYAAACGIEVNGGGIAHLDLQDINTQDNMSSTYFSGGAGGAGAAAANGVSGSGGKGGDVAVTGVHVASGKADGSIGAIKLRFSSGAEGGIGGVGKDGVGNCGSGGDAGAAYAAGVRVDGGEAELTVASMDINVKAAAGGNIGALEINDINKITATGTVQAAAGKGGTALAVGVDNRGGSSNVTATGDIKIAATGGTGGAGAKGKLTNITESASAILAAERASGAGGAATAVGLQNTAGSLTADVQKLEITATGGFGAAGMSSYGAVNGVGAKGGAAAAYGINVLGGLAENLTAAEITVQATGGTSYDWGDVGNYEGCVNADGAVTNEAYAVYADKGTVLFGSNAALNWDGSTGTDNALVTRLNNATLGFSGTAANRTVTGGKLQLTGSNAFRFTTDLANNKADSMTFDTIENNSSKQYIQIGYEEAFKNALSEADIVTVNGSATVLKITNLNGQNLNNFVGQASSLDSPLERFRVTPKVEASGNEVKITEVALAKEDTPSETAMTLSDAQMALGSMWRIEGNNLMKRMGDLRSDKEAAQGGVWARYYRGELNTDSAYDRNFSQDYTAFQGGIDKVQDYKGGKLYTGIAINRIDSNAGYTAGSGDLSSTGVGLYASWLGGKGHYLDVIARGSKLTNDFKLVDLSGNAAKADYDTWAYGISAEYGYRQNLNAGWFVEPQAELSLGHLGSADYTTSNGVSVKQDSVNSAVVRLGFLGGKEFTIGGHPSNAYVKASALHDFGGNGGATGYYENSSLALKTGDLTGTWYEIGLGANLGIAKNSNLYFDALKTFGGDLRTDWQFNAGLRFTF